MKIPRWQTFAVLAFVAAAWLGARALGSVAQRERASWPPIAGYMNPDITRILLRPYPELAADITWIRTLVYNGSSMVGEADYRYLGQLIDSVIKADPHFYRAYRWAAYAIMYQQGQSSEAKYRLSLKYLEQGMALFPDKYELFWLAGLRYYFDLPKLTEDPAERLRLKDQGAALMEQAMHKPDAPDYLAGSAANMRLELGQKERALHDLREMILSTDSEEAQKKLIEMYSQLAGAAFPDEERRAKAEFEKRWQRELPFATPSMYVILGDRPSPVIDFDKLATERDLFGAEVDLDADRNGNAVLEGEE